jgi:hypothetical protein
MSLPWVWALFGASAARQKLPEIGKNLENSAGANAALGIISHLLALSLLPARYPAWLPTTDGELNHC